MVSQSGLIEFFASFLDEGAILQGEDVAGRTAGGLHTEENIQAKVILRPKTTEELSKILSACHESNQPIVVHGGLTGLVFGTRSTQDQLVISLERMNQIENVDLIGRTIACQSGTTLQTIQEMAEENNMMFPLDLGARGSCSIGGNIATNAGGNRVIRYGMMRDSVLGLEAVLADGTVLTSMNTMIKNNAGYDLKQLFIGTEGTLGIVTRCVLRLREAPLSQNTGLVALENLDSVIRFLKIVDSKLGGNMSAFEVMWNEFYKMVVGSKEHSSIPLAPDYPYYVLVEALGSDQITDEGHFESVLSECLESSLIKDAVLAKSDSERQALWAIRDDVEQQTNYKPTFMYDVSLPISSMEDYISQVRKNLEHSWDDFNCIVFGHLADGNLHLIVGVGSDDIETQRKIEVSVYEPLKLIGGSVSAEHGIGFEKKQYLNLSRTETEIELMKGLKQSLDPRNILNPGLIF